MKTLIPTDWCEHPSQRCDLQPSNTGAILVKLMGLHQCKQFRKRQLYLLGMLSVLIEKWWELCCNRVVLQCDYHRNLWQGNLKCMVVHKALGKEWALFSIWIAVAQGPSFQLQVNLRDFFLISQMAVTLWKPNYTGLLLYYKWWIAQAKKDYLFIHS